jgi:prepilin-type N-terminal cleavage/methylation domain-containing protein
MVKELIKDTSKNVIPAKAGIHKLLILLDSRLRGSDKLGIIRGSLKSLKGNCEGLRTTCLRRNASCRQANSELRTPNSELLFRSKGFTLIEIIVVIVILAIVSAITIKFLTDSLRVYTMTVNQKTLFDEGKLALERMCRDIRDARSITGVTASSITFVRNNATAQDIAGETLVFQRNAGASTLEKVKASPVVTSTLASNVSAFAVTNATNEIQLQLTLQLTSGENVALQTKVYPKNLAKNLNYKNLYQKWMEDRSS